MTTPIAPGDFVECVDADGGLPLRIGAVFTCSEVNPMSLCPCGSGGFIFLKEIATEREWGWCINRFRPIHRPSASKLMDTLKEDTLSPHEKGEIDADVFTDRLTR